MDLFYFWLLWIEKGLELLEFFRGEVVVVDFYLAEANLRQFKPLEVLV